MSDASNPLAHSHPLDNPARAALLGPHAHFAQSKGDILRYPADVTPFVALPDKPDDDTWRDVAELLGPGGILMLAAVDVTPPADWEVVMTLPGVQLVGDGMVGAADSEAVRLGVEDVPEMLALVARTKPGPFLPRTIELGSYLGHRQDGELVAMAGERLHPQGWTEISAVCTHDGFRGRGLATRLVLALVKEIHARGDTPFLHAADQNPGAIRLYESLGFRVRRRVVFSGVRVPGGAAPELSEG